MQELYGWLSSAYSLRTAARICLEVITSTDEALHDLGIFVFVVYYLLSVGRRHAAAVTDILPIIERLEELHTKMQGMIKSFHFSTTLLFDVFRWWSLYLNM